MPAVVPANLILLMLFIQLAGFVGALFKGRNANANVGWVSTCLTGVGLGLSIVIILVASELPYQAAVEWFWLSGRPVMFGVLLDKTAVVMLIVVHFVALLVEAYSLAYMHREREKYRYFAFLKLFVFSMLGIVVADNLLILYIFWELVGLSSYLLIGYWNQKMQAVRAAKKAFLLNRIGDAGFLLGIFLYYQHFDTFDLSVLQQVALLESPELSAIGLLLFCGCLAKSAQFPLHGWLPDAMEGPTPVSALIHAATMVAAGIYLLGRIFPLLTPTASLVIALVGLTTALLGGLYALAQTDIKKVLAYSTVSQLGLMVLGMGVGAKDAALFHLLTHAFFKAGLFLGAGSVIFSLHRLHGNFDDQDLRLMGGLRRSMPVTFVCYTLCTAALVGLPLSSGFLSKDALLGGVYDWATRQDSPWAYGLFGGALLAVGTTALYMCRQWWLIFMGDWRNPIAELEQVQESPLLIKLPIEVLAVLSVGFAFASNPLSPSSAWFLSDTIQVEHHWIGLVSTIVALAGLYTGYRLVAATPFRQLDFTIDFDKIYQGLMVRPAMSLASVLSWIDRHLLDGIVNAMASVQILLAALAAWTDRWVVDGAANALAQGAGVVGKLTRRLQSGYVQWYVAVAVAGLLGLAMLLG